MNNAANNTAEIVSVLRAAGHKVEFYRGKFLVTDCSGQTRRARRIQDIMWALVILSK